MNKMDEIIKLVDKDPVKCKEELDKLKIVINEASRDLESLDEYSYIFDEQPDLFEMKDIFEDFKNSFIKIID